jgi:hypothetical protein
VDPSPLLLEGELVGYWLRTRRAIRPVVVLRLLLLSFNERSFPSLAPLPTRDKNRSEMPVWEGLVCDACGDHEIDLEEAVIWQEDRSMICPDAALARIRVRFTGRCSCGDKCRPERADLGSRCHRCLGAVG